MSVTHENTYWNHKGKHEELNKALEKLVPAIGEIPNANLSPALETFRIASNCYYDLYNNGLCNRGKEFHDTFGFDAFDIGQARGGYGWEDGDAYSGSVELNQALIDRTETRMDEIILAAYAEQFPPAKQEKQTLEQAIKLLSRVPIECITTPQIEKEIADFLALK